MNDRASVESVAPLGLVSPGEATEGVTHTFPEKLTTFLVTTVRQFCSVNSIYFFLKTDDLILLITVTVLLITVTFILISLGCNPPGGCHPAPFLPVQPHLSTVLCKFTHNFFLRVSPHGWCHPGRSAPSRFS